MTIVAGCVHKSKRLGVLVEVRLLAPRRKLSCRDALLIRCHPASPFHIWRRSPDLSLLVAKAVIDASPISSPSLPDAKPEGDQSAVRPAAIRPARLGS
jgi:hypothetical protein